MFHGDQQVQRVLGFIPWMLLRWLPLPAQCVDLDVCLYYAAVQNLVCGCVNVLQTTAECSDTPPIYCTQRVQQSVNMSIQLPADPQWDPVQMAVVVQQEYVLVGGAWLYPRGNVANIVNLSKQHSYCLQSQQRAQRQAS